MFLPGNWDVPTFLFGYTMIAVFPAVYFGWKWTKMTQVPRAEEVNVFREEKEQIDEYQASYVPEPPGLVVPL